MGEENTQQEQATPILYTYSGQDYRYDDLKRRADYGLNDYIRSLGRGEKDFEDFRNAYIDIMQGIADGSVTFDTGRFHDSKGRYKNVKNRSKDYYGLMANYIYDNMIRMSPYKKPEPEKLVQNKSEVSEDTSKIKWDDNSLKTALMRQIYNRDEGNIQDFLDLDEEKDGVRGVTKRSEYLSNAFRAIADNWDNLFQDYKDTDKNSSIAALNSAADALKDGTLNPGDYLTLSRAIEGVDFRKMFEVGSSKKEETKPTTQTSVQETPTSESNQPINTPFLDISYSGYSDDDIKNSIDAFSNFSDEKLGDTLANVLYGETYFNSLNDRPDYFKDKDIDDHAAVNFILNQLLNRGLLKETPDGEYYIPGFESDKKKTGLFWDRKNNKIIRKPYGDYYTAYKKKGGILYAGGGDKATITAGSDNVSYSDLGKLFSDANVLKWLTNFGDGFDEYAKLVKENVDQRYNAGINNYNNESTFVPDEKVGAFNRWFQDNSKGLNYTYFGDSAENYDSKKGAVYSLYPNMQRPTTPMGTGDRFNGDKSTDYVDNALGVQTYSRVTSLTNKDITDFGEWGKEMQRRGATGAYYYVNPNDKSGKGQWIPTNDKTMPGYIEFPKNLIKSLELAPTIDLGIDQLNKEVEQSINSSQQDIINKNLYGDGSEINPTQEQNKYTQKLSAPDLGAFAAGIGRVIDSARTNKQVENTVGKVIKPVLKDPYELYSPVTGDFATMQAYNQRAAEREKLASTPLTSDASLMLAGRLEANKQADDLRMQGLLKDNAEWLRTAKEARDRQEANIKNRNTVANLNKESIHNTNVQRAMLKAQRLQKDWESRDTFSKEIQSRLQEEADYLRQLNRTKGLEAEAEDFNFKKSSFSNTNAYQEGLINTYYNNQINAIKNKFDYERAAWEAKNPNAGDAYKAEDFYKNYVKEVNRVTAEHNQQLYDFNNYQSLLARNLYSKYYPKMQSVPIDNSKYQDAIWWKIINKQLPSNKRGGKLSLITQHLLNKVIR